MEAAYVKAGYQENVTKKESNINLVRNILSYVYILVPIAAGADKFLNILTEWTKYVNPLVTETTGISAGLLMSIAGIVEIFAGIFVFLNRRTGAYIVAIWLTAIALQLITGWMYIDIAVRDLVMAAAAFCLGLLSERHG